MGERIERAKQFFVSGGDTTEGPYDVSTLRARVASGEISRRYQVWDELTQSWAPISVLEPLLRLSVEITKAERKKPTRVGKPPLLSNGSIKENDEEAVARLSPRLTPTQRELGNGWFTQQFGPEADPQDGPLVAADSPTRRRNYSPIAAGSTASRPFDPASAAPLRLPPPAIFEFPETPAADTEPWPLLLRVINVKWFGWLPVIAASALVCALMIGALGIGKWISFGHRVPEENAQLTAQVADQERRLADKAQVLRGAIADRVDLTEKIKTLDETVRALRISVFAAARRAVQTNDRFSADQRLFELDRLNAMTSENESETKTHRDLVDEYFFSTHPGATSVDKTAPLPTPAFR